MSTNFPASLDTTAELENDKVDSSPRSGNLAAFQNNAADAILALEAKVGVNSSAVTSSLDYKIANASSSDPGHVHTNTSLNSLAYTKLTFSGLTSGHAFMASGATSAAFRAIAETDIADGSVFPRLGATETITGAWTHSALLAISGSYLLVTANASDEVGFRLINSGVGNSLYLQAKTIGGTGGDGHAIYNNAAVPLTFGTASAERGRFTASGGLNVGATADIASGVVNANTGFRVAGAAASGNVLRGNGTNFVSSALAAADIASGAALTRTDDTNVTLTLGGSPTTALLAATSLALGWTGTLAVARGGIGVGTLASNGVLYGNGTSAVQALAVNSTGTNKFLRQVSSAAPSWEQVDHSDLTGLTSGDPHTQYRLEADNHSHQSSGAQGGTLDHGLALTGLTDDDHTQYALLAGRSGGQSLIGGTASADGLTLRSTSHATKGKINLGNAATSAYDEANDRLGIGTASPTVAFHVSKTRTSSVNELARFLVTDSTTDHVIMYLGQALSTGRAGWFGFKDNSDTTSGYITLNVYGSSLEQRLSGTGVSWPNLGTTASAANAFLDSGANNNLLRSTSARRYKQDIVQLDAHESERILSELRPVSYRSAIPTDDQQRRWLGLVAEEVAEVDPSLVHWADGLPDGVQYDRLGVLLISQVQRLTERVKALEAA